MKDEERIRDIKKCKYIKSDSELFPLQRWYNQLIDKKISAVTVADVLRMIKQNEFIDIAIYRAVSILKENPFIGDVYEGELLEKIFKLDIELLEQYIQEIRVILEKAIISNKTFEWLDEEERRDFEVLITAFLGKI